MLLPMCGRWYSHFGVMWWLMLLPSGRWNGHCRVGGIMLADVIANWQMLLKVTPQKSNKRGSIHKGQQSIPE